MFHHPCAPRVLFIGLYVLVLFVTLAVSMAADSFGQNPPITPSEGWNTQVSNPLSLPSNNIQYDITGGTRPGGASGTNLFHSFGDFSVPTNSIANFLNAGSIDLNGNVLAPNLPTSNILGRVTGGDPSIIFGLIQTNGPNGFGAANLFLINPAGFLFGPNATVNVGGMVSFTTADYVRLTNATFNAVPNTLDDALLTAMPVATFGFLGPNAASIVVQGGTLKVAEGQALSLIGGNRSFEMATETASGDFVPLGEVSPPGVVIAGGTLSAPSGHISIVSVDSAGEVIPAPPNEPGGLNVSSFSNLGRVELSGNTMVDVSTMLDADFNPVSTQGNGTVSIRGGQLVLNTASITALNFGTTDGAPAAVNIDVQSDTTVSSSIIQTFTLDTAGGDITITSGSLTLTDSTAVAGTGGAGIGGDIAISTTGPISITNSFVQAVSETDGAVGSINISATSANGSITVGEGAVIQTISGPQNGGAIVIQADQHVTIENGGMVVTSAPTSGAAGDITITAGETVTVSGLPDTLSNVIATSGGNDPTSKAGDILITATNFLLQNNAQIDSDALIAQPGNITVTATDSVNMSGGSRIRLGIRDQSGGAIDISGQNVSMNSASIRTRAAGSGNAGAITLGGTNMTLTDSQITASTHDSGRGGDVTITAQENLGVNGQFTDEFGDVSPGGLFTDTQGTGAGGNIFVNADSVTIQNGGTLSAKTSGNEATATGGTIIVNAYQVNTDGATITVETTGAGQAGSIALITQPMAELTADAINLYNSLITSSTSSNANAGDILMQTGTLLIENSQISSDAIPLEGFTGGNAGTIQAQVGGDIALTNSVISTASIGNGNAGNILMASNSLQAESTLLSSIAAAPPGLSGGNGGTIQLNITQDAYLSNSTIDSQTVANGSAGNVFVDATNLTLNSSSLSTGTSPGEGFTGGNAGDIQVTVGQLTMNDGLIVSQSFFSAGNGGTVAVNASESITTSGSGILPFAISTSTDGAAPFCPGTCGNGGNITLMAPTVILNGAGLNSTTTGQGNAGNILTKVGTLTVLNGAQISASAENPGVVTGAGGNVTITGLASPAQSILIDGPGSGIFTETQGTGAGGNIFVDADSVTLQNGGTLSAATSGTADSATGGTITVNATQVELNLGMINASTGSSGDAGAIHINATDRISLTNRAIIASASENLFSNAQGNGGTITLHAPHIVLSGDALVSSSTTGPGNAGNVVLETQSLIMSGIGTQGGRVITNTQGPSQGGNITVQGLEGPESAAEVVQLTHGSLLLAQTIGGLTGEEGNAGSIHVQAAILLLDGFSQLSTAAEDSAGGAGTVIVDATDSVHLSGGSSITSNSAGASFGQAGDITITSPTIWLKGASFISTSTEFVGNAGNITLHTQALSLTEGSKLTSNSGPQLFPEFPSGAAGSVKIQNQGSPAQSVLIDGPGSGIFTDTQGTGAGGNIFVNADSVTLQNGGSLSAKTSGTEATATGGTITVDATNTVTMNSASITASSTGTADAGSINITAMNGFTMQNSTITTQAGQGAGGGDIKVTTAPSATVLLENSMISASVGDGPGGGGNIWIDPQYVILQNSQILARAAQGQGGTITITANLFLPDATSIVNADSGSGVNGTVTIQSPNAPASGKIQPLGKSPLLATSLLNQRCAALTGGEFSSFTVAGRDSLPTEPGSWLASPLALAMLSEGARPAARGEGLEGMSASARRKGDAPILSLRQIAPTGFLTQTFATDSSTGCS